MKNLIFLLIIAGCTKDTVQIEQTKFASRGAIKTITVSKKGKYRTLASIYPITPNTKVLIGAGIYNEQLILSTDVQFILDSNTIIDYNKPDNLPTVTNNVFVTNCSITGGTIKRTNSTFSTIVVYNGAQLNLLNVNVKDEYASYGTIHIYDGDVTFAGSINTKGSAIVLGEGKLNATGDFYSEKDYTIWLAGGGTATVKGNVISNKNSAIGVYNGYLDFEGTATSYSLFGFEMGGGSATLRNSFIESKNLLGYQEGDAINKYGGENLYLDNCTMKCASPDAYSLSEEGRATNVILFSDCYANRNKSSLITLQGTGNLIIQP